MTKDRRPLESQDPGATSGGSDPAALLPYCLAASLLAVLPSGIPFERRSPGHDWHPENPERCPPPPATEGGAEPTARPFTLLGSRLSPADSPEEGRGRAPPPTPSSAPCETSCTPRKKAGSRRQGEARGSHPLPSVNRLDAGFSHRIMFSRGVLPPLSIQNNCWSLSSDHGVDYGDELLKCENNTNNWRPNGRCPTGRLSCWARLQGLRRPG